MSTTLRDQLIASGLFKHGGANRDLVHEEALPWPEGYTACTRLYFDAFGDITNVKSYIILGGMRAIVAANRRASGLPPQENP